MKSAGLRLVSISAFDRCFRMLRRAFAAAALALFASASSAQVASFPDKPMRFVVGFTPGGPSDILAREIPKWTKVVKDSGARAE